MHVVDVCDYAPDHSYLGLAVWQLCGTNPLTSAHLAEGVSVYIQQISTPLGLQNFVLNIYKEKHVRHLSVSQ